jgi:uncharacterized SAM-binding protein YcdF (DUF218 family)
MRRLLRVVWRVFLTVAVATFLAVVWFAAGGPLYVDRWLDVTQPPVKSEAIVVLAGGTVGNLPLPQGWDRLTAAAHLFTDQMAPVVIFSGGGTSKIAEAEIYANAAAWLGVPRAAMAFESKAQTTGDHGFALLDVTLPSGQAITTSTPLLVVTSTFHSRRALYSFARAGFTHVRIVSTYTARGPAPVGSPAALTSTIPTHRPSGKSYNDFLFRSAYRAFDLFIGLRELGAMASMRFF